MNFSELFYRDKPLFGLDIGHSSIKVMQIEAGSGKNPHVAGYGMAKFPPQAIVNGIVVNFEAIGKAMYDLFKGNLHGVIYTRRVACSLPTSHTYNRLMKIPAMADNDIGEAIRLEAEQYIPMPINNLYMDYEISKRDESGIELLMVATPKNIVDSYMKLLKSLDLEPVALEPSVNGASRLFGYIDAAHSEPSILIDFGSVATDVAVFDRTMIVNSTIAGGSEAMTKAIAGRLKIDFDKAFEMKSKYGIGVSNNQQQISEAIAPMLEALTKEVRRVMRYYNERVGQSKRTIAHIITSGGGATMPGINQYLTKQMGLPAQTLAPWNSLDFGSLKKPSELEQSAYITVAGEAILNPKDIFA
jgi:type IV pilus assembly protein PilM